MNHTHEATLRQVRGLLMQAEGLLASLPAAEAPAEQPLAPYREPHAETFYATDGFEIVRWRGHEWHMSAKQRAVVKRLYDAAVAGKPEVAQRALLDAADSECASLRDLFRDKNVINTLIVRAAPTVYRLACFEELRAAG